jgi:MoxR-like ATPase
MQFEGTSAYVAEKDLTVAVNAAIRLERPLLVKGEPGTGKTELAVQIASALGLELIEWSVKSTTKAHQGLYEYDAVSRLRDSQLGDERVNDVANYIRRGKLWEAFAADKKTVLLIDEIDKADIEFPNDLLQELDRMEFFVYETGETIRPDSGRSSSSHRTTRRNCPTRSCAAASSTISAFPTWRRCSGLSMCIIRGSSRHWSAKP